MRWLLNVSLHALFALLLTTLIAPRVRAQANQVSDIHPGANGSFPAEFQVYNGHLYFQADDGTSGAELWVYDGTSATMAANIAPGSFASSPKDPVVYDGKLYFQASDAAFNYGTELWVYDHATQAASVAVDINAGSSSSSPAHLTVYDGLLHFRAFLPGRGTELWASDGSSATRLTDVNDGAGNADPQYLAVYGDNLYFSASDGTNGRELWTSDGTTVSLAANINSSASSSPQYLTVYDGALYFVANGDAEGRELWSFDGTSASLAADLTPGPGSSFPAFLSDATGGQLTVYDGKLYFPASTPATGTELFVYDGAAASVAADISTGSGSSSPQHLTVYNNKLYFSADGDGSGGRELWVYDGTSASLAAEINPGSDADPKHLTVYNDRLYFQANDGTTGAELWSFEDATLIPVELTSFEAAHDGLEIHLAWRTASETHNAGFAIEHAVGTETQFEQIDFVEGHGTTTHPQVYTYRLNASRVGFHRFRLKQIDFDGAFTYSPEVEVHITRTEPLMLAPAYPNPFNRKTTLRFAARKSSPIRLALFNALGQEVLVLFEGVVPEDATHTVHVSGNRLPSGVYFARLTGKDGTAMQQLVLRK